MAEVQDALLKAEEEIRREAEARRQMSADLEEVRSQVRLQP